MIEVNARSLDRKYLMEWATRLGVADRSEELLGASGE